MHRWSSPAGPLSRGSTWVSDAAGDKLGLGLGKPAANLGLPELRELESDGVEVVDLVGDRTLVGNSDRRDGSGGAVPQNAGQGASSAGQHLSCAWRIHGTNLAACRNSWKVTTVKVSNHCLLEYLLRNTC